VDGASGRFQEDLVRTRVVIAIASLTLMPADLIAQRVPIPPHIPMPVVGSDPAEPQPLPKVPEPIARELAYKQSRVAVESYPLMSVYQSSGFSSDGRTNIWTTLGVGTRGEYHFSETFSATLDLTSSVFGGPAIVQTAELGARMRPAPSERRLYPYVDVRAGYVAASPGDFGSFVSETFGGASSRTVDGAFYSRGFSAVAGVGAEYALTRRFYLTTGATLMRSRLTSHDVTRPQSLDPSFTLNAFRYMIGLRYNPVRIISTSVVDGR
jgi:hypothetical protein